MYFSMSKSKGKKVITWYGDLSISEYIKIIGIDYVTEPKNTGLLLGLYSNGIVELQERAIGTSDNLVSKIIYNWIKPSEKILLAIDAL